jgi:hypothetical protein
VLAPPGRRDLAQRVEDDRRREVGGGDERDVDRACMQGVGERHAVEHAFGGVDARVRREHVCERCRLVE